jgi:hypothetical protein
MTLYDDLYDDSEMHILWVPQGNLWEIYRGGGHSSRLTL